MANASRSITTLVTTHWLAEKISSNVANFRILDASWHMPFTRRKARQEFFQKHIPGAQFFDIDDCCDKSTQQEHMLPNAETFEKYVGNLGISNNTHVVVYDNNNFGLFSAQRVWWTFRVFGHDSISILNGGLPNWEQDNYETIDEVDAVEHKVFKAKQINLNFIKTFEDMERNIETAEFTVVDARPAGRFEGTSPEPRPGIKPGHMPGSLNIPFTSLLDTDSKTFKTTDEIKQLFQRNGVDLSKPLVATCGSGISACMIALGAFVCDKEDVAIYDGSWTEWYQRANHKHIITSK